MRLSNSFSDFFEYLPIAAFITEHRGKLLAVNQLCRELIQDLNNNISDTNIRDYLHPDCNEEIEASFSELLTKPENKSFCHLKFKEHSSLFLRAEISELSTSEGNVLIFYIHKSEEQTALKSIYDLNNSVWQQLTETVSEWITICDLNGIIINSNKYCPNLLKTPFSECIGKSYYTLLKEINIPYGNISLKNTLEKQIPITEEIEDRANNKWYSLSIYPIVENNKAVGTVNSLFDITTLKKNENALAESERKFRVLVENLPGTVYLCDPAPPWKTHYISPSILEICGYTAEEFTNASIFYEDIIHPEDRVKVAESIQTGIDNNQSFILEYRIIEKNKNIRFVYEQGCPIYDEQGKVSFLEGFIMDITEKKLNEEKIFESEERLRMIFNQQYQLTALLSDKGIVEDINDSALKMINASKKDIQGKAFWETPWWTYSKKAQDTLKKIIRDVGKGNDIRLEIENADKDRQLRTIDFSLKAVKNVKGQIINLLAEGHDITDIRKTQQEKEKLALKYQSILEGSKTGIIIADSNAKVLQINSFFTEMTDIVPEEVVGKNTINIVRKYLKPEIAKHSIKLVHDLLRGKPFSGFQIEFKDKILDIYSEGYIPNVGIVAFVRDISELKDAEAKLRESNRQIRQLIMRIELVREEEKQMIAREIHDELGQMLTAAKMDLSWLQANSNESQIQDRLKIMEDLINNTISVVKKISSELRPNVLDDLGLPAAVEWFATSYLKRHHIKLNLDIKSKIKEPDKITAITVYRILQESLNNVVKHAKASKVDIYLGDSRKEFCLRIADNGIGFDPLRVFSKETYGILGMKERIMSLNGQFLINKAEGGGTIIEIKIPKANHYGKA